jgi:tRNA threonylcarbamoyladenosine modification (KEOPS) complex  Pcc1 subunit
MSLQAQITITQDIKEIKEVFLPEEKEFSNKRASYELLEKDKKLIFDIKAKDVSALRAVMNSITKILSVYYNAKNTLKKVK